MERKSATGYKWWDKLGKPHYGNQMVIRIDRDIVGFDPYFDAQRTTIRSTWMESLAADDWTLDPALFDYKKIFCPNQYRKGHLAESWEFQDLSTIVIHLRHGIHWQDLSPVNGREFTADDVVYHYHRLYGLGSDITPSPHHATAVSYKSLISVTAIDKYTVVFKWKTPNPEFIMESLLAPSPTQVFEAREAVERWGDLSDWHHAIGTGPFILNDFVPGESATLIKNPYYWGCDERYPKNQLPYVDGINFLIIPDNATALATMRAGKIDLITPVSFKDAQSMDKTNPEILQIPIPFPQAISIDPRIDKVPFNDIRVRKAMQMVIDLPAIAKDYYHGAVEPYPSILSTRYMKEWGFPYEQWPQDLKDEYAYNPAAAKKLLAQAGYPFGFKTNIVADDTSDMDLLQIVKSYFAQVGIDMEIRPLDSVSWQAFVLNNHKHDQLVQRSIPPFGYAYEPIRQLYWFQTGHGNHQMLSNPILDTFYPKAMAATSLHETLRIFKDANEYVARQHFKISLLQPIQYALCQPWLKGYNGQFGSILSGSSPGILNFFLARFWIDNDLKKSMKH